MYLKPVVTGDQVSDMHKMDAINWISAARNCAPAATFAAGSIIMAMASQRAALGAAIRNQIQDTRR